jgi:uncharacterized protein (TIGR03437 family)
MSIKSAKKISAMFFPVLVLVMFLTGTSHAVEFFLRADVVTKAMPDGANIKMWGFARDQDNNFTTLDGFVRVPGPQLTVPPGDTTLTIHLLNKLPVPVSIVIPGQIAALHPTRSPGLRVMSFTDEAAPGGEQTYTWNNLKPGTYLYQSGTNPAVQVQMGLYGALIKNAATLQAYADPATKYDQGVVLVYSEIDPVIHKAVAADNYGPGKLITSTINYAPKYFLINGHPYAAGSSPIPAGKVGEKILLRFLNAGLKTHVPVLQGMYMDLLAEDGNLYPYKKEQYSVVLPAGKTIDAMITPAVAGDRFLYDRLLNLTNSGKSPGGMLVKLDITP